MKKISMQGANQEITFEEAFNQFIRVCKTKNLAEDTIKYYERCRNSFVEYFDQNELCSEIDHDTYLGFIEHLQGKDIKDVSINTNLRGIRTIFNFCIDKKYMKHFKIQLMKIDKTVKEVYTDDELNKLLRKPDLKKCSFAEYRSWVMSNFVLGTGQRISSMLNIKIGDVFLEQREVIIRKAKGRKQLIIPLSTALCKILEEYFQYRGDDKDGYLFPNQFGKKFSRSGAEDAIADYNNARGVSATSIHRYRYQNLNKIQTFYQIP